MNSIMAASVAIVLIVGPISCVVASSLSAGGFIVSVDSVNGNDSECYSLQEMQAARVNETNVLVTNKSAATTMEMRPCKTLNRALGDVSCRYQELNPDPLQNVVVRLLDGVHRLADCIAIGGGQNVTVEAVNNGQASVECAYYPDNQMHRWDGLRSWQTVGLTFKGVRFEHCGYISPAVFLNHSTEVVFEDCVFA